MITKNAELKELVEKLLTEKKITIDQAFMLLDERESKPLVSDYHANPLYGGQWYWDAETGTLKFSPYLFPYTGGTGTYTDKGNYGALTIGENVCPLTIRENVAPLTVGSGTLPFSVDNNDAITHSRYNFTC